MPEEVKFNEEELKEVQNIRQNYLNIQQSFGQLKLAQMRLENQEIELEESLKSLQNNENKFLEGITKKYGDGALNPETGVFTPSENKSE